MRQDSGFTLVETLVGFAIAALAVTAYQQLSGQAVRMIASDRHREEALLHGMSEIEAHIAGVEAPVARSGRLASGMSWRIELAPIAAAAGGASRLVRLRYIAFDATRRPLAQLETMMVEARRP